MEQHSLHIESERKLLKLKSSTGILIYLLVSLFMFAFVNVPDATLANSIMVPYINGLVIYYHVFLTAGFLVVLFGGKFLSKSSVYMDMTTVMLALKCVFDLITYAINSDSRTDSFFGYYACSIVAMAAFFIGRQYNGDYRPVYRLFMIFGVILSVQVVWTSLMSGISYLDLRYKIWMNIPYAASNVIASALVPLMFFAGQIRNKLLRIGYILVLTVGLILTKSRGGILLLLLCLFVYLYASNVVKKRGVRNLLLVGACVVLVLILLEIPAVQTVLQGYHTDSSFSLDDFTTGRFSLFTKDLEAFTERPIFGHGLGQNNTSVSGTHNIIIDLLYKCGFLGTLVYLVAVVNVFKTAKSRKISIMREPLFLFVIIVLVNSMFEVCYFSYKCDALFWAAAGFLCARRHGEEAVQ